MSLRSLVGGAGKSWAHGVLLASQTKACPTPHKTVYGPDVYDQWYFRGGDFPRNTPSIWYNHFGFAESVHGQRAVVVGEYGGFYGRGPSGRRDGVWHDALVDWLLATCLEDTFYWCINPNVRTFRVLGGNGHASCDGASLGYRLIDFPPSSTDRPSTRHRAATRAAFSRTTGSRPCAPSSISWRASSRNRRSCTLPGRTMPPDPPTSVSRRAPTPTHAARAEGTNVRKRKGKWRDGRLRARPSTW